MKYLKTFEENENEPQVGDYVIVRENRILLLDSFFSENVGRIVDDKYSRRYPFLVQFENIPDDLKIEFGDKNNSRQFSIDEIDHWSKNKEDLELMISANKYNL
jgi:hypothetical protein